MFFQNFSFIAIVIPEKEMKRHYSFIDQKCFHIVHSPAHRPFLLPDSPEA